jgi:dolichol-phosphate mannosyltransferase
MMRTSVVVPCFNEQEVIEETHKRLKSALSLLGYNFEIIYVNDGSKDCTFVKLVRIAAQDQHVRVVSLSRNFGHQIALTAGLDYSTGDVTVIIDADLQDPPELIQSMIQKWREGYKIVYGKRILRLGESTFKRITAKTFYKLLNLFSEVTVPPEAGDFRLLDKTVVADLRSMPERRRFIRGLTSWVGYPQYALEYIREPRFAGRTKYNISRMIILALDGVLSFSTSPLRTAIWLGFATASLSFFGIIYAVVLRLLTSYWVSGWTLLFVSIMFIGGVQLIFLGVVGEYVGRIFHEVKARPLYFVAEVVGPCKEQPTANILE